MKKRVQNFIIIFLFCIAVFSVPIFFFVNPKVSFSDRENRYLADAPALDYESVISGDFTKQLGDYVADHFPERDWFVGINAYYDLYSGRQITKDYYLSADGRLFAKPTDWNVQALDANIEFINDFSQKISSTGAGIPVSLMLVPSSGAVLSYNQEYPDEEIISYVNDHIDTGNVDLLSAFRAVSSPEDLYHWTSEGAFLASCIYRRSLGLSCLSSENYTRQKYEPFYGSAYTGSGLWLTDPDSLELWYSENVIQVENETGNINGSVLYPERLEERDKYQVFLDGNHALVRIENLSLTSEEKHNLLVIRDSFSNSLGCFLADLYDKVVLIDLRYYKLPLTELFLTENINEVLIEYSVENFLHDANLAFLSLDPEPIRLKIEEENRPPNYFAPPLELSEEFFDDAYYLGDSVNGVLATYCTQNGKLRNTVISTNAMLSYHDTANQLRRRLIYKGNYATLPALGCNDLATYEFDHCKEMFVAFLELVRETNPEITIFIQSVMPIRVNMTTFNQTLVDEFNYWLKDHAEEYDYCYIELGKYFKATDGELDPSYMYNATHINLYGAPVWYRELMNGNNYFHFPEQYFVEYDGSTDLPIENGAILGEIPDISEEDEEETLPVTLLDTIFTQICEQTSVPDMLELNERTITSYLGLLPAEYLDGRFYLCANNLKADEIWLLNLNDDSEVQSMLSKARERISVKADSYEKYLPEESELARQGIVIAEGNYIALFISPDAAKMQEIFLSFIDSSS